MSNTRLILDETINEINKATDVGEILEENSKTGPAEAAMFYDAEDNKHGFAARENSVDIVGPEGSTGVILDGESDTLGLYGAEVSINSQAVFWGLNQLNPLLKIPVLGWGTQYPVTGFWVTTPSIPHTHAVAAVGAGVTGPDTPHTHTVEPIPLRIFTTEAESIAKMGANLTALLAKLTIIK